MRRTSTRAGSIPTKSRSRQLAAGRGAIVSQHKAAWSHWESQPPGYRKLVLNWITTAKRPETRAKRLATLIEDSAAGRRIAGYDWRKKP